MLTKSVTKDPALIVIIAFMIMISCGTVSAVPGSGVVSGPLVVDNADESSDTIKDLNSSANQTRTDTPNKSSGKRYVQAVPEKGDPYFEAAASDGSWISYQNPRDEYRSPYLGDGSAKICITLQNEAGETIVGDTVPNTTVVIPTGTTLDWHSAADPITVDLPLTRYSDRPLDADQFGTSDKLPQGDGYLDSHCFEFHGLSEESTVEYGEVQLNGEHADEINVVGYIQQEHEAWNSAIDPNTAAESYNKAGGGWTYQPGASHGQVVIVLQLDSSGSDISEKSMEDNTTIEEKTNGSATDTRNKGSATTTKPSESTKSDDDTTMIPRMLSFSLLVVFTGLVIIVWNSRDFLQS